MTKEETKKLIFGIQAVYGTLEVTPVLVDVWHAVLERWPYMLVHSAVLQYLSEAHEFPCKPGQINQRCINLNRRALDIPTGGELWEQLCGFARSGLDQLEVVKRLEGNRAAIAAVRQVGFDRIRYGDIEHELPFIKKDFERHYNEQLERDVARETVAGLPAEDGRRELSKSETDILRLVSNAAKN